MTLYQTSYTYTVIDTPLSDPRYPTVEDPGFPEAVQHIQRRVRLYLALFLMAIIAFLVMGALAVAQDGEQRVEQAAPVIEENITGSSPGETAVSPPGNLSPIFSREVQHWKPEILAWSAAHGLDPNITATIMQIESCGDPQALSHAGAHGLFQVMPFHFEAHEDMFDPDTNAFRGLSFYTYVLEITHGDVALALAGYNGGPAAAQSGWSNWVPETQRYYTWGKGIYEEAAGGLKDSPTLQAWMDAGGRSLCGQASRRLGLQ